jgi:hypothetical protein
VRQIFFAFGLCLLCCFGGHAMALPLCATNVSELRLLLADPGFPLVWEETTMNDHKPLRVSILEKDGGLWLEFIKTGEGLWVQSTGLICQVGDAFETHFGPDQIRLGPAANWVLRLAMTTGGTFTLTRLSSDKLRIKGGGWSGTFSPSAKLIP